MTTTVQDRSAARRGEPHAAPSDALFLRKLTRAAVALSRDIRPRIGAAAPFEYFRFDGCKLERKEKQTRTVSGQWLPVIGRSIRVRGQSIRAVSERP
jgi:hypothetical protein